MSGHCSGIQGHGMDIQAAVAHQHGTLTLERCQLQPPQAREVLVALEACGICHTDLLALNGELGTPLPAVLGHEGVGRIMQVGEDVEDFAVGERVLMSFGACGECPACRQQASAYCRRALPLNFLGQRLDGSSPLRRAGARPGETLTGHFFAQSSFATHAIARTTNLVTLPEDLPAAMLAPLACGVQTGVSSMINVLQPQAGQKLVIFGCGTVGLSALMAARNLGCEQIVAVDLQPQRLQLAAHLGATHTVAGDLSRVSEVLKSLGGVHAAFDCTGHADVIALGFSHLLPQGKMLCAGVSPADATLRINPRALVFGGRSLLGTVEGNADPRSVVPFMIDWYRQGRLPLEQLVSTYAFADIQQAMDDLAQGRVIKPVLLF